MTENVCKNCNAPLDLSLADSGVITCSFCGSVYTLPKDGQSDAVVRLISAGQTALDLCRFDDALTAFTKAIELDGSEPEAYWGRALARFRVQYLRDTVNNRLQPICHEVAEDAFTADPDYKKALELATDEQRAAYGKKGEEIDYIRGEFYALAQSGLKYDCFICVKVTDDADGRPTADSRSADRIFRALEGSGYKPFYSEYETGARTGADYEALILYALHKAPCMLVVCSDAKYLETKWVRNEYTRYLAMLADGDKERSSITIAYRGKVVERLPGVRGKIQGIDLSEVAAIDRIRAFIDSHDADKQRKKAEREAADKAERAHAAEEKAEAERKAREAAEQRAAEMERRLKELEAAQNESKNASKSTPKGAPKSAPKPAPAKPAAKDESKNEPKSVPKAERPAPKPAVTSPSSDFEIKDGVLVRYHGKGGDVTVPAGVTSIGETAFEKCKGALSVILTSVSLPESVTGIERCAFERCDYLTNITLPAGLTNIGDSAFKDCKRLKSVTIPAGVTSIAPWAFRGCGGLTSVTIPDGVTGIGDCAFSQCGGLTNITLPAGLKSIGYAAFSGCRNLTDITIPSGVEKMGQFVFKSCGKVTVRLDYIKPPSGNIPQGQVKLQDVYLNPASRDRDGWYEDWAEDLRQEQIVWLGKPAPPDFEIENGVLVRYRGKGGDVIVPDGVKSIAPGAFRGCGGLTSVTIPDGVTSIWGEAFRGCSRLTGITLPASVTVIGGGAFEGCSGLADIALPAGLTEIGNSAFSGCGCLTGITLPTGVRKIGDAAFKNCGRLTGMTLPAGVAIIGAWAFAGCSGITAVTIPESVTSVGGGAFDTPGMTVTVDLPARPAGWATAWVGPEVNVRWKSSGTTSAQSPAAPKPAAPVTSAKPAPKPAVASPLSDFEIKNGVLVKYLGKGGDVIVPAGVTDIRFNAFSGCGSITSITLPDGLRSIGFFAFNQCGRLTSVTIPGSVTSIGHYAFSNCDSLISITLPAGVTRIEESTFSCCGSLANVTLPNGLRCIENDAFNDCGSLTGLTLPAGLTEIGGRAFWGCNRLNNVTIPATVTRMGKFAFATSNTSRMTVAVDLPARPAGWDADWAGPLVTVRWKKSGSAPAQSPAAPKPAAPVTSAKPAPKPAVASPSSDFEIKNGVLVKYRGKGGDVTVPAGVTSIGAWAFAECSGITAVTIPERVTSIGEYAFDCCDSLTSVTLPAGLTEIGESAFWGCNSLTNVTIPATVTKMGKSAFATLNISSLTTVAVDLPARPAGWDADWDGPLVTVRWKNSGFAPAQSSDFEIKDGVLVKYRGKGGEIVIPDGVTEIGDEAFRGCENLLFVRIPDGVTHIGGSAFERCKKLTRVSVPDSLKSIGDRAFWFCDSLTGFTIPAGVEEIGEYAFCGCKKLTLRADRKKPLFRPKGWDKDFCDFYRYVVWKK